MSLITRRMNALSSTTKTLLMVRLPGDGAAPSSRPALEDTLAVHE
jgi:hypothetical protein